MPVSTRREAEDGAEAEPHNLIDRQDEGRRQSAGDDLTEPRREFQRQERQKQERQPTREIV